MNEMMVKMTAILSNNNNEFVQKYDRHWSCHTREHNSYTHTQRETYIHATTFTHCNPIKPVQSEKHSSTFSNYVSMIIITINTSAD